MLDQYQIDKKTKEIFSPLANVVLMIAVALVIVAYAQEVVDEDLELAETKGKKHTRHIQPNNRPSPQRFRPRIRTAAGQKGRGRSDSSENGGSNGGSNNGGEEYDANDGYIVISYGGRIGKGKKGQRYGNKYGSDYSVEYVGNVYGYEDDHGHYGGFYDDGYNTEQEQFKGSTGTSGGESTGSKGNSESTGGSVADAGGSDVTSGKGESEGSKGNSGSMSDAAVTSGDAMGGKGSKGESMSEVPKGNVESVVDSTLTGGDAMEEEGTMGETGSKDTGESMGEGSTGGDAGTTSDMGDIKPEEMVEMDEMGDIKEGEMGDVKEAEMGEMGEMGDVKEAEMGNVESEMEVTKVESMGAESDVGDATGDEESKGMDGSMTDGEGVGGDDEKFNSGKSGETGITGTKDSVEAGGSAEDSEYILEVVLSEDEQQEENASNKGSAVEESMSKESPATAGNASASSVTMEKEKAMTDGSTTSGSAATVISSAMSGKEMSLAIDEMLKMAQMIKIDEMIKNGEMSKVDEMLKNAEMINPEVTKEIMSSITMEKETKESMSSATNMEKETKESMSSATNMEKETKETMSVTMEKETKASGDGASNSTSGSNMGQRRIERNGTPRPGKPANGDRTSITAGKVAPVTSTNRLNQVKQGSSKSIRSSSGSQSNSPVNVRNAGSTRSKPDDNQWKPIPPRNNSVVNGNRNTRPSGNKVSSVPESRAKKSNVTLAPNSKSVRSPIGSVDSEKKLPGNGEKVNSSGGKSNSRPVSAPIISPSVRNSTTNTSTISVDGERRFLNIGNWRKQEKGTAASGKSVRSPSGASSGTSRGKAGPGNGEKVINRGIKAIQSKPAQVMKPPSKLRANPMMGDTRPTFFTESRLKGETSTTEKSIRTEKGGRALKNSVKEKRGIPSSAPVNSKPAGNKGEKGSRGSDSAGKGNGKREIVSTTETPVVAGADTGSVAGEKQNSGFVRNASPLSIVRYLRKGIGRYL